MDVKDRVLQALVGIEGEPDPSWEDVALINDISDPPTYVVFLTLCRIAGLPWHSEEKMLWRTHVQFRGLRFSIADWKGGAWTIRGIEESTECHQSARQLRQKITAAARLVEPEVEQWFARDVEKGDFYVENSYYRVRPLYEHYREQLIELRSGGGRVAEAGIQGQVDPEDAGGDRASPDAPLSWLARALTARRNYCTKLSFVAAPMVVFFFSYTEIILDVLFAFQENRDRTFTEFRSQHWDERFKQVLPVSRDKALHSIYQGLLDAKRTSRDAVAHGFGCNEALLVSVDRFGLVPVSYAPWARKFHLPHIPVSEESAHRALDVFDRFDDWLEQHAVAQYAVLYARSGFPIPLNEVQLARIRGWMRSREVFQMEMQRGAELQDTLEDRWF